MTHNTEIETARARTCEMLFNAGVALTLEERSRIEIVAFGLGELEKQGLQIVTYINNDRYCAKEIVLFPRQTCPQHLHPPYGKDPGKMETFRCRWGKVFLYVEGQPSRSINAFIPYRSEDFYTVFQEVVLEPGQQFTIPPSTLHWFQAGDRGAIVSEFSSTSRDALDIFTDTRVVRVTQ
ncbi:D-lyxose/D-mannose family sugar isomerase [Cohnella soli]|uniref:D-lyxose/D-mannose family sugar isomerase n=1 Tax=Cohnella soli TaxID=425005 RepID=A0ABW0I7Y0_9BACL